MLFTVTGPLLFSFERRLQYYKKWKFLVIPFIVTAAYFIVWDAIFTARGIWSFNEKYILGYKILLLPVEEWMFFFCVPFSCIFIYEAAKFYLQKNIPANYALVINGTILIIITIIALLNLHKTYTAYNFISAAVLLSFIQFILKPAWLGRFYVGYFLSLIPFFIVNGILTCLPVATYNNSENLGIRIFTIPVEDTIYCLLLLMMNIAMYEGIKNRER
jgi:lycopene cyclase domain-containing protein